MLCILLSLCRLGIEQFHVLHKNFSDIAPLPFWVVIAAVADAPFDIELVAFVHMFLYHFGQSAPHNEIVAIGVVGHLCAILQDVATLCRRKWKLCHSLIGVIIAHVGIFSHVTNQHHFIHCENFKLK